MKYFLLSVGYMLAVMYIWWLLGKLKAAEKEIEDLKWLLWRDRNLKR